MANIIEKSAASNKYFGDLHVLKDIDLTVEEGEKVVIVSRPAPVSRRSSAVDYLEDRLVAVVVDGTPLTKKNHLEMARTYSSHDVPADSTYPI